MINFMKISGLGAEIFRAKGEIDKLTDRLRDGQTDVTKLIAAFRNFAKRS